MWDAIFDLSAWAILVFYIVVVAGSIGFWIWMTWRSWKRKDIADRRPSSLNRSATKMRSGGTG